MLKDCRECGKSVANRAKTCPNCGVKKPTATKAEAGLDSCAAGAFSIGLMLCLLVVVIVACVSLVGCSTDRPDYCDDYDTWAEAEAEMDTLEARNSSDMSTWSSDDLDSYVDAIDRRGAAANRVWAQAPDTATITSVRTECS